MSPSSSRLLVPLAVVWGAGVLAFVLLLQRPAPLFVNVGAGDTPFLRGFRERWERDGLTGSGETMFRWAEDGSRVELPVSVGAGHLRARVRMARFAETPADIAVESAGHEVDRWTQPPRGWRVREIDLGEASGPIVLTFRSRAAEGDPMAVAVDWIELEGAGRLRPSASLAASLALFFLGPPLVLLVVVRSPRLAVLVGAAAAVVAAVAVGRDRLGGAWACAAAAVPLVIVVLALALLDALQRRAWPDAAEGRPRALAVPLLVAVAATAAFSHPFHYYPDVDSHARFLQALRANPSLLLDPTQPWQRRGDVTREIGGQKVAIPYAMVFHASAWPLTAVLEDVPALKTMAVLSAAALVLLVHPLARAAGLAFPWAALAQAVAALLPVLTSRLSLALYPTLFGEAWVVLLLVHLARRLGHLDGARDGAAATTFVFLAEAAYTGSLVTVSTVVFVLTAVLLVTGEWRRALRLSIGWAIATAILMLTMYVGFLPTLWHGVLPHIFEGGSGSAPEPGSVLWSSALARVGIFYDAVFPILAVGGLIVGRAMPVPARRVLGGSLAAGLGLLVLRYVVTTVLRDAKDVELLLAPMAVLATAGLAWLWSRGRAGQVAALLALAGGLGWAAVRDVAVYSERFLAVGR